MVKNFRAKQIPRKRPAFVGAFYGRDGANPASATILFTHQPA
jgi:hypothetical protein